VDGRLLQIFMTQYQSCIRLQWF